MITNPRFAVLYVSDQEKALRFFTTTLGFEKGTDAPYGENLRWLEVCPPGSQTYLVLAQADPEVQSMIRDKLGPMSHVWFNCDDLDATFADLRAKGVEFPVEPQVAPWDPTGSTRWAQFADPEGTVYGLSEQN